MVAIILPDLCRKGWWQGAAGLAAAAAFLAGAAWVPGLMLIALAVAHNATPVGFLAERLKGRARTLAMAWCAAVFVALPAAIAAGAGRVVAQAAGLYVPDYALLPVGVLADHLRVYVPAMWTAEAWAADLFAAAVFMQCMHYVVVVHVLPPLLVSQGERRAHSAVGGWRGLALSFSWRNPCFWVAYAWLISLFLADFTNARYAYGLAAAVHAWIEIPLLLLALPASGAIAVMGNARSSA
ncbi:hypothetical protein DB346_21895 [Verrucomicrobia bacterium LW23]|nr:hypothetical protein DB346_21895 [Verrucomicrobia bacterium LW23]